MTPPPPDQVDPFKFDNNFNTEDFFTNTDQLFSPQHGTSTFTHATRHKHKPSETEHHRYQYIKNTDSDTLLPIYRPSSEQLQQAIDVFASAEANNNTDAELGLDYDDIEQLGIYLMNEVIFLVHIEKLDTHAAVRALAAKGLPANFSQEIIEEIQASFILPAEDLEPKRAAEAKAELNVTPDQPLSDRRLLVHSVIATVFTIAAFILSAAIVIATLAGFFFES